MSIGQAPDLAGALQVLSLQTDGRAGATEADAALLDEYPAAEDRPHYPPDPPAGLRMQTEASPDLAWRSGAQDGRP